MNFRAITLLIATFFTTATLRAQMAVGTTSAPHPSAQLEVVSSNKGLLIPRLSYSERMAISNPATGLMVYQTDWISLTNTPGFYYYEGADWKHLGMEYTLAQAINTNGNWITGGWIDQGIFVGPDSISIKTAGWNAYNGIHMAPSGVLKYNGQNYAFDDRSLVDKAYVDQAVTPKYIGKLQVDIGSSGSISIAPNTTQTLAWVSPYIDLYPATLQPGGQTIRIPEGVSRIRISARIAFQNSDLSAATVADKATVMISLNGNDYGWSSMRVSTNQEFLLFNGWNFTSTLLEVGANDEIQVKVRHNSASSRSLGWGSVNNTHLVVEYYR